MANDIPAVFGLNRYLWKQMQEQLGMTTEPYGGLTPLIPNGEVPQLLQAIDEQPGINSYPYIVYTWYTNGYSPDTWYRPTDTIIYTVYSLDQTRLRQLILLITNLFKRYDDSAQAVNAFIQGTLPDGVDPQDDSPDVPGFAYRQYHYNYTYVAAATGGQSTNIENDPITATITVRVGYTNPENDLPLP